MAKTQEQLKSQLADLSGIPTPEEVPNTEFFYEPQSLEYTVLLGEENDIKSIIRVEEGCYASIPIDEQNNDYQRYLAWVAEGNTPEEIAL